jgi:CRP-like cAMP-binding protein
LFLILVDVVSAVFYSYFIGTYSAIFIQRSASSTKFEQRVAVVRHYIKTRMLPDTLRDRILDCYQYRWEKKNGIDEASVLADLPVNLRHEVVLYRNVNLLSKVPLFKELDDGFLASIVMMFTPITVMKDEIIYQSGETAPEMYFIFSGQIELRQESDKIDIVTRAPSMRSQKTVSKRTALSPTSNIEDEAVTARFSARLQAGSYFGEEALLKEGVRSFSAVACEVCELFLLTRDSFEKVLRYFPEYDAIMMERIKLHRLYEVVHTPQVPRQESPASLAAVPALELSSTHLVELPSAVVTAIRILPEPSGTEKNWLEEV